MLWRYATTKALPVLLFCLICLEITFLLKGNKNLNFHRSISNRTFFKYVNNLIQSQQAVEGQACRIPILDVNATEILALLYDSPKVVCNKHPDWIEIDGSVARISDWAKRRYKQIECEFSNIYRISDFKTYKGEPTTTDFEYILEASDVVKVRCNNGEGKIWQKVLMGIRSDSKIFKRSSWSKVPNDALKLNVLIFGFDSLSHNMWKRKLPKTYKYATKDLEGIALNAYNIIGDGTPMALVPILTGKTEWELPETRKIKSGANYVDVYPFIWNDFQKIGYVTGWSEDLHSVGTFTYRMTGFNKQPVDHYMRTFYLEATPYYAFEEAYCYGNQSRLKLIINFVINMYKVYRDRPKFTFVFHSEYSHDSSSNVHNADDEVLQWLQDFKNDGQLNNTLLLLMSDHGSRFAAFRNTQQGKQEERLPGFIFVFPEWFKKKYLEAYANFQKNADRLSTPFDIHETLKDVMHFRGAGKGSTSNRGISLFKEIPLSRTCKDAYIESHWCSCLNWETISLTDPVFQNAVTHLLNFINRFTSGSRDLCEKLSLGKVLWGARLVPNGDLLRFKKSLNIDGTISDMSHGMTVAKEIYQIKASLEPGNMIFEASVTFSKSENTYAVSENEISRINKYKDMTHCLEDKGIHLELRKFCNCRNTSVSYT